MSSLSASDLTLVMIPLRAPNISITRIIALISSKLHSKDLLLPLGIACTYFVFCGLWLYIRRTGARQELKRTAGCKPAVRYPHCEQILGLDLLWPIAKALRDLRFLGFTRDITEKFGSTIEYLVFGNAAILTTEPENIKAILSLKFQDFGLGKLRKQSLKPLFGNGIFNVDGLMWQHSRAFLRPHFTRQKENVLGIFERHTTRFFNVLPKDGSTFDVQDLVSYLMMDIATEVFLGESTNVLESGSSSCHNFEGRQFSEAFEYASTAVSGIGNIDLDTIWSAIFGDRKLNQSITVMDNFLGRIIQNAVHSHRSQSTISENNSNDTTFLDDLVNETNDTQKIKHSILNILLAGKDTVTALLSNTLFVLAKRPDIYAKLRSQVENLGSQPPSQQQLKDLTYFRYVLNESLRLFPPVPLNQRTAEVDTVIPLGGGPDGRSPMFVAKGVSVGYSVYAMHRRRDIYGEDADDFRPERWENLKPGWGFLPFNGGPRACLGQQYSLKKVMYILVRFIQNFEVLESRDSQEWQEKITLTCFSRNGVKVALVPAMDIQ